MLNACVCHWFAAGWWLSPGTPVDPTNNTDRHDIAEILLKVVLNTITSLNACRQLIPTIPQNTEVKKKKPTQSDRAIKLM